MNTTSKSSSSEDELYEPLVEETTADNVGSNINNNYDVENIDVYNNARRRRGFMKLLFTRKQLFICSTMLLLFLIYRIHLIDLQSKEYKGAPVIRHSHVLGKKGYLVWSDKCKILDIDSHYQKNFHQDYDINYSVCPSLVPITNVEFSSSLKKYILSKHEHFQNIPRNPLQCCYEVIQRSLSKYREDNDVFFTECRTFGDTVELSGSAENILVKCKMINRLITYNAYAMMPERDEILERINSWKNQSTQKPVSVLMLGVDSISIANLVRQMPDTAQYLYENEWYEMSGYTKVNSDTFAHLMAILTGYNESTTWNRCNPTLYGGLDECPFVWKTFQEHGYVTAYAEDSPYWSTFNFEKKGFQKEPVDYYLRPFLLGAELKLPSTTKSNKTFCLAHQPEAFYVYDYAVEMATRFHEDPYFGLFWSNDFRDNNGYSLMDEKLVNYFKKLNKLGVLDQSIVIFFSNHGKLLRRMNIFSSDWKDQRPFLFIWLPQWLHVSHPEFVNALSVNKNRLTSAYDLHMTLKHILELSGRVKQNLSSVEHCPKCQTLFKFIPHSRSCSDAAIDSNWCICIPFLSIDKDSEEVREVANFTISYINDILANYKNGSLSDKCYFLYLSDILRAQVYYMPSNSSVHEYRLSFKTGPIGMAFTATVERLVETGHKELKDSISRLSNYSPDSDCIDDDFAKSFCSCKNNSTTQPG